MQKCIFSNKFSRGGAHVDPGSQADRKGVRIGWEALEVAGEKVDVATVQAKTDADNGKFYIKFVCL